MARALGMTYANYWRLESGRGAVRLPLARLVAALLQAHDRAGLRGGDAMTLMATELYDALRDAAKAIDRVRRGSMRIERARRQKR